MKVVHVYIFALIVFILKEPFVIGLTLGRFYFLLYFFCVTFVVFFMCKNKFNLNERYLVYYGVISFFLIAVPLVSAINLQEFNALAFVKYIASILVFYVIYEIVCKIDNNIAILKSVNYFSIVLSLFSIITLLLYYYDVSIFPVFSIFVDAYNSDIQILFPFTIVRWGVEQGLVNYRSYSYFTEPAAFSFFITPLIFFNVNCYLAYRSVKYLLFSGILFIALLSTLSIAGIGVFILFSVYLAITGRFGRTFSLATIIIATIVVIYATLYINYDSPLITRRLMAINNRLIEWGTSYEVLSLNPFGVGLGNAFEVQYIFDNILGDYRMVSSIVNVVKYVQSFGFLYIIPLFAFIFFVFVVLLKLSLRKGDALAFSIFLIISSSSVFFISLNYIFSPIYLLYLAVAVNHLSITSHE